MGKKERRSFTGFYGGFEKSEDWNNEENGFRDFVSFFFFFCFVKLHGKVGILLYSSRLILIFYRIFIFKGTRIIEKKHYY